MYKFLGTPFTYIEMYFTVELALTRVANECLYLAKSLLSFRVSLRLCFR